MTAKEKLREKVEAFSEQEAAETLRLLELRSDPVLVAFRDAPVDDEPLTSEEEAALAEADQVIYAEIAVGFATRQRLERALQNTGIKRLALPWASAWRVAQAFTDYRRAGGPRTLPLPDFFIGAHAEVAGLKLLTRDPARIRTYFSKVELIAP